MSETGVVPYHEERTYMPVMQVAQAVAMYQQFRQFVAGALREGTDYGKIPGTEKPTLLKPGAEKCCKFFGLSAGFTLIDKTEDWDGSQHGGTPLFDYTYKCQLFRNGVQVAECEGSANTWEERYRYRNVPRKCPKCGSASICKGSAQYGGGFYCNKKTGGCGAKFKDDDKSIVSQQAGKILNTEPYTLKNTVQKQGQKRAFIGAVLIAVNASDYFTQDIEDMSEEVDVKTGEVFDAPPVSPPPKAEPTLDDYKSASINRLAKHNVTQKQAEEFLERDYADWTESEVRILHQCCKRMKSGESWEAITAPRETAEQGELLQ